MQGTAIAFAFLSVAISTGFLFKPSNASPMFLSRDVVEIFKVAIDLSILAFSQEIPSQSETSRFESFDFWADSNGEPDQALVAKLGDTCWGAFRGTENQDSLGNVVADWLQNIDGAKTEICSASGGIRRCCSARRGFVEAYHASFQSDFESALRSCAATCTNPEDCVRLTGSSQGGAIAAVAAVFFADLNPTVITFGQPPALSGSCTLVQSSKWYRFINTDTDPGLLGLTIDPVTCLKGMAEWVQHYGHAITMGNSDTSIAYGGLNAQCDTPIYRWDLVDTKFVDAHSMYQRGDRCPGYRDRIEAFLNKDQFPLALNGFAQGEYCTKDNECETNRCKNTNYLTPLSKQCTGLQGGPCNTSSDCTTFACAKSKCSTGLTGADCDGNGDCRSSRCDGGKCLAKLGSRSTCNEYSDCLSNKCLAGQCTQNNGKVANGGKCYYGSNCDSGRCEGYSVIGTCYSRLGSGSGCNENSDCNSNHCRFSWWRGWKCT